MKDISMPIAYGNEVKQLRLYMAPGAGGSWYVSIDKYHYGQVIWQLGKWNAHINPDCELTTMDITLIESMVTEVMPEGPFG